jgi:alkanesulfonate monooxygenase SsuD/methylene tetrahydromethanopterin reductase-like flavin-dependent oxidoreductase (luciferase family)
MKWDTENGEFKASFESEALAEAAAKAFLAAITDYVNASGRDEEKKWFDQQKFAVRVRPITDEYMELDWELADSLEEAELEHAGFLRKLWHFIFGKRRRRHGAKDSRVFGPAD